MLKNTRIQNRHRLGALLASVEPDDYLDLSKQAGKQMDMKDIKPIAQIFYYSSMRLGQSQSWLCI